MLEIKAQEFVRRLRTAMNGDSRFAFFLGAGASVSSGIPSAGTLVRDVWLPRLKEMRTGKRSDSNLWAVDIFAGYTPESAAKYYGPVIEQLFLSPEERQNEIERLVSNREPGFGYAVLSQLISHRENGKHCNVIITTNFDDMVQDALYLYTNQKPLVIVHESLVGFVKVGRTRPLIIKIHGDARLAPKNTETETEQLTRAVRNTLKNLLREVGLVFIGYGGNDSSIASVLKELDDFSVHHKDAYFL